MRLSTDIKYLSGVGPKRAEKLNKLGINTVEDLLFNAPRTYENRMDVLSLAEGKIGEFGLFKVTILEKHTIKRINKKLEILSYTVGDATTKGQVSFFNQSFLAKKIMVGKNYFIFGKYNKRGFFINIDSPELVDGPDDTLTPIYSLTEGINQKFLRKLVTTALLETEDLEFSLIPKEYTSKYNLPELKTSISCIHFPKNIDEIEKHRRALSYYELFLLQITLEYKRMKNKSCEKAIILQIMDEYNAWIDNLPYQLTGAQKKALTDIETDFCSGKKMNRLIQGDVGSGKTVVAFGAMLLAVLNGYQAVIMAPTEILANQHFVSAEEFFKAHDIRVDLLTGSMSQQKKNEIYEKSRKGEVDIIIGTHALIQEGLEFSKLALIITDEQHRFGVSQRNYLSVKNPNAHVMVMSATPIPRTMSMIVYGDLDISVIDELPPGRNPVKTYVVDRSRVSSMYEFIREQLSVGRQAYIVCPLIEENEKLQLQAAFELYEQLKNDVYPEFSVALMHGKLSNSEKDVIMEKFVKGEIDLLVSTTVVEVGVNVPNSNIIVIFNAERFGLASLHQLRGRVGRGQYQSYCILINTSESRVAWERMKILERSNDGFEISQADLEIRGPGDYFGTRQSGIPKFKFANLMTDKNILIAAKNDSREIIQNDPKLKREQNIPLIFAIENMNRKLYT